MPKETIIKLGFAKKQMVYEKLKEVCRKIGDGRCEYISDWDDYKVAEVMGVKWTGVRSVRREMFGNTRGSPAKVGTAGRLVKVEDDLRAVMAYLTSKNPAWKTLL